MGSIPGSCRAGGEFVAVAVTSVVGDAARRDAFGCRGLSGPVCPLLKMGRTWGIRLSALRIMLRSGRHGHRMRR
jgi:hypothetical protein